MGLFDFAKKKAEPAPAAPRVPVDEVVRMRRQGLTNNQVIQALQRNGFQTHQIFDAFSQADLRIPSAVQGMQQPGRPGQNPGGLGQPPIPAYGEAETESSITGPQNPDELPDFDESLGQPPEQGGIAQPGPADYAGQGFPTSELRYGASSSAKIEEVCEAIIEEKWQDLMKDFAKVMEWKSAMEQRMAAIEQRLNDLKSGFDNLQRGVMQKVSDYDKSVKDVGSEMKALEQVFQKIIPTLTENVNELSRITKGMKSSGKK